ncbi:MAG: SUMF1/EgtB/PvdO family nonheme iron enzyme [Myxococcota bacterium]
MWPLLTVLSAAHADTPVWPDLSAPPVVGGGDRDAGVIVAIEDYSLVGDIPGARDNGLDWYSYLTEGRGISARRVKLLINQQAVREEIVAAVSAAAEQVQPGGTLWFVFIGHGAPSEDGRDGLLIGWDTQQTANSVYARGLPQKELIRLLESNKDAEPLAIIDACFSGQLDDEQALVDGLMPLVPTYATASGRRSTILSAGRSNEFAGPLPGADRPAFSYLALGALYGWGDQNDDGDVNAEEVVDYSLGVLNALPLGRSQTPSLVGDGARSLGRAQKEGPSLSQIRRTLEEGVLSGAVRESGAKDFASKLAELDRLRQEEAALAQQIDDEIERQRTALKSEAHQAWQKTVVFAESGDGFAVQALDAYIDSYTNRFVEVGDRRIPVSIPEVNEARRLREQLVKQQAPDAPSLEVGGSGYEMIAVQPGSFTMGCAGDGGCESDEKPPRVVQITRPFLIGRTEVTQELWKKVTGDNPSDFDACGPDCPVEQISWLDAVIFANQLSEREGLDGCYVIAGDRVSWPQGLDCNGYRLPTEAEWEYAARAGHATVYAGTSERADSVAWYTENSGGKTHPVGQLMPNAWGLHDMTGNVWEWVWDQYGTYPDSPSTDPLGPVIGSARVFRGGGWFDGQDRLRVINRAKFDIAFTGHLIGLRLVRSR